MEGNTMTMRAGALFHTGLSPSHSNLRLIVSDFLDIFFDLDVDIAIAIASLHASRSTALAQLLELLQTRRRRVLVSSFSHDSSSNLGPFLCLEFLFDFLLGLKESLHLKDKKKKRKSPGQKILFSSKVCL